MVRLLHESIEAGGIGFSTTLAFTHSDGDGQPVASRWASNEEVLALCGAVREHEGTTLEYVTDGCMRGFRDDEVELMAEMTLAGRRPLNWNVLTVDAKEPERYRAQLAACENAATRGGKAIALTMPMLVEMNMSFRNYCALFMLPDWNEVMNLPVPERIEKLQRPGDAAVDERARPLEGGRRVPAARLVGSVPDRRHVLRRQRGPEGPRRVRPGEGAGPGLVRHAARHRDQRRAAHGPVAACRPTTTTDSWKLRADAWRNPNVLIGGSDAGAHLDRMCGAPYTTVFLADMIRGRKLVPIEEAVHLITQAPAELFGLRDRGVVREGFHADLVVFDPETVGADEVRLVEDLPGGTARLFAGSTGVHRVFVNGRPIVVDGATTGDLPGTVLRSGRDTRTVPVPAGA